MAEIAPLTPLRYDLARLAGGLADVVAPPYDVIDAQERAELAARDPHNIVRVILPEAPENQGPDAKYARAAELLAAWRKEGALVRDDAPAFYRYDQSFVLPGLDRAPGAAPAKSGGLGLDVRVTRRGFLGLVRLVPFSERIVLPHERTLSGPKEDRLKLFRATQANLSPGFMLYRDARGELDGALASGKVFAEWTTRDGVQHSLAKVDAPDAVRAIVRGVGASSLLIADGHHRYETALRYAQEQTDANPGRAKERGRHRYFMTFLANGDDPKLVVFPTHRHVHSLARFSFAELLEKAGATFDVRKLGSSDVVMLLDLLRKAPAKPAFVVVGPDGAAALLTLKSGVDLAAHPTVGQLHPTLRKTDVGLLHAGILEHILGITKEAQAAKTNIWYPQDARAAIAELKNGRGQCLFLMNATPVSDVRTVAEAGEVMPQKSTFFYPKVLTGLAIHTLEVDVEVPSA